MHPNIFKASFALATTLLALAVSVPVEAAFIVAPDEATASSAPNQHRQPVKTVDGSGLSDASIVETGDPVPTTYPTHDRDNNAGWFSDDNVDVSDHSITFDLDGLYELTGMYVWNWNFNGGGTQTNDGINDLILEFSNDGIDFSSIPTQSFSFAQATNSTDYAGEGHTLSPVTAGYVRFNIQSTFEHASGEIGKAAFAEARFEAVPEPTALVLVGVGLLAVLSLRRPSTISEDPPTAQ